MLLHSLIELLAALGAGEHLKQLSRLRAEGRNVREILNKPERLFCADAHGRRKHGFYRIKISTEGLLAKVEGKSEKLLRDYGSLVHKGHKGFKPLFLAL